MLLIKLLANILEKAVKDALSILAPATHMEDQQSSFWLITSTSPSGCCQLGKEPARERFPPPLFLFTTLLNKQILRNSSTFSSLWVLFSLCHSKESRARSWNRGATLTPSRQSHACFPTCSPLLWINCISVPRVGWSPTPGRWTPVPCEENGETSRGLWHILLAQHTPHWGADTTWKWVVNVQSHITELSILARPNPLLYTLLACWCTQTYVLWNIHILTYI